MTLTLAMIVRNEGRTLPRCLLAVRDLIDRWVIVDTGSADDTVDIACAMLDGVPGELHRRPWVNFGHNRNELLDLARPGGGHLLTLDADHELHGHTPFHGTAPAYDLVNRNGAGLEYSLPLIQRADLPFRYVGRTHEYLSLDGAAPNPEPLPGWLVIDHADGGHRAAKFQRDAALLEADLAEGIEVERSTFYLAITYKMLGNRERARQLFDSRMLMGAWHEEKFVAALEGARCSDGYDEQVARLTFAHQLRPERNEPLFDLAGVHMAEGNWAAALRCARKAVGRPAPPDRLFVDSRSYGRPAEDLARTARAGLAAAT